ncbi:MAG: nucleotidyltransferase domain-containing protein [Chloroflexi bacterium]|nr:nucleotidyltransferase domain-containing protein [Chloroflexota bacterium]
MQTAKNRRPSSARRQRLTHLKPHEQAALATLVHELRARYGDDLQRVALFGSKARGDFHAEPDLDILVVVRTTKADYRRLWNEMVDMAWCVELTFGVVISLIIKDLADYDVMRAHQLLLARNIERDGVDLWTLPSNAPTSRFDSPKPATIS